MRIINFGFPIINTLLFFLQYRSPPSSNDGVTHAFFEKERNMCNSRTCPSPVLHKFCVWFRDEYIKEVDIPPSENPVHTGYRIRSSSDKNAPRELELIESLLLAPDGDFHTREHLQEGLEKRFENFNLSIFEKCIEKVIE